jgi:XTP/dITP diphosphohydrolase
MPGHAGDAIVIATRNRGKIRELAVLFAPFAVKVLGLDAFPDVAEVEESGVTFAENAVLKAVAVSKATGLPAVADDSGLEVDALRGAPGVYSARYSQTPGKAATDERNLQKVLQEMKGLPPERRAARFRCCMAAATPRGCVITCDGAWAGLLTDEPAGDNGFGYDPIFFDPALGRTAAQLSAEEKNARSHRAKAVAALLARWPSFWRNWLDEI